MLYFRIACLFLLFTGVSHLAGHFLLLPHFTLTYSPIPTAPAERATLDLMNSYHKVIGGKEVSYMDIQNGLSLCYALFFSWLGLVFLMIAKGLARNKRMLSHICLLNTAMLMVGIVISYQYFFWVPLASFVIGSILFIIAALRLQRDF
jgi:hypothetical protein